MRLLRDLLDNEIRHGEEDKLIARDNLIGAEAEHPYAARGASFAAKGNKLSCPWAHGVVRRGVGRNGVVAKTYAQVTLRVELEGLNCSYGLTLSTEEALGCKFTECMQNMTHHTIRVCVMTKGSANSWHR